MSGFRLSHLAERDLGEIADYIADHNPSAAILMVAGVGLFGTFSGFVAAWFLAPGQANRETELAALQRDVTEIKQLLNARAGCQESALTQDAAADAKPAQPC